MHDFKAFPELTTNQAQFYYFESPHKQIFDNFTGVIEEVIDGDTVRVKWSERNFLFKVRLADIAAPELKEDGGREAKDHLVELCEGAEAEFIINPYNRVGKWGRLIATIIARGFNLNKTMVRDGHAIKFGSEGAQFVIDDFNKMLGEFEI